MAAIDMRKSIDSLSVLVSQEFNHDPLSGHVFIFFNRCRDKVKIIYWDKNGYALHYKRMEKHRFFVPNLSGDNDKYVTSLNNTQGAAPVGSVRYNKEFIVHPDAIKRGLKTGEAFYVTKVGDFKWDKVRVKFE
jgi:hypothetical protein